VEIGKSPSFRELSIIFTVDFHILCQTVQGIWLNLEELLGISLGRKLPFSLTLQEYVAAASCTEKFPCIKVKSCTASEGACGSSSVQEKELS